jgi:biopolymer transport protein TolR
MALSANDAFAAGGRRRRRGRRRSALSEINVTPLVDVMLVLLIIFMISAPLLTVGVPVELPKTEAGAMDEQSEPLTISIKRDGAIYMQETEVSYAAFGERVRALAGDGFDKPVYVRADGQAPYEKVAQVMAVLSTSGFTKIGLLTDTGDPAALALRGGASTPAAAPEAAPLP